MQHNHIQGWEVYPLELQNFRPYIDNLQHLREQLQKKSSLLFVKDSDKIALELLLHNDDGKTLHPPIALRI